MTPSKKDKTTIIRIEKVKKTSIDESKVAHKAGGPHSGLVINKQAVTGWSSPCINRLLSGKGRFIGSLVHCPSLLEVVY